MKAKKISFISNKSNQRRKFHLDSSRVEDLENWDYDSLFAEDSSSLAERARKLQIRRWRRIKQQLV
jgi:hypothetical protein